MKKVFVNILLIFLIASLVGCARKIVPEKNIVDNNKNDSGKYEYFLSEALRQKYLGSMSNAIELLEECIKVAPEKAVAYFELSQIFSYKGNNKEALNYAVKAAEYEKSNQWLQFYAGGILANAGLLDSSAIYLERGLKLEPENSDIKSSLARVYLQSGYLDKAEPLMNSLKDEGRIEESEMINMINSLSAAGFLDEAKHWSEDLLVRDPNNVKFKAYLAEVYRLKGLSSKADSIYGSIIKNNPDDGESQMLVMSYVLEKRDYENAISFLSTILISENISRDKKVEFVRYILTDSLFVNRYEQQLELNLMLLESQFKTDEEVLSLRPSMYVSQGMKDKAIKRDSEIIAIAETTFFTEQQLIILLAEEKRFDELLNVAKVFSKNYNKSVLGKVYYAVAAMELGKYDIADEELKKAFILAGNNEEMQLSILSMQADLEYRRKNFNESFKYLELALMLKADDIATMNNYAYYLAENNSDLQKALLMAEKVVKAEPLNVTYIDTYGWVLYKLEKYRKAYKVMNRCLQLSEERDPEYLEHMGFILQKLKKFDLAVSFFEESMGKDPTREYLKTEIEKCRKRQ